MAGLGGTDHAGQNGRRGSRDSGQTANMVLAEVQIETGPPEQRVRRALQCVDQGPDTPTFDQPSTGARLPLPLCPTHCPRPGA